MIPGLRRGAAVAVVVAIAAGCDIPTDPPIVEQRWVVPLDQVILEQSELVPDEVTILDDAYDVQVGSFTASESLGSLCTACTPLNGLTAPVPAFSGSYTSSSALPADVVSAELGEATVDVQLSNGLTFDPLAGGGVLTVTIVDGFDGTSLGSFLLESPGDALPPGSVVDRTVPLASVEIQGPIEVQVEIDSPGGEVAEIDVTDQVSAAVSTSPLLVTAVTVLVDGRSASLTEEVLDTEDVDQEITDGVQEGTVVLDVSNPFGISFSGDIVVGTITKTVTLGPEPNSTVPVTFTGEELRSILGTPGVVFSGSGLLSGGPARVTPSDTVTVDPSLDVVVQVGG